MDSPARSTVSRRGRAAKGEDPAGPRRHSDGGRHRCPGRRRRLDPQLHQSRRGAARLLGQTSDVHRRGSAPQRVRRTQRASVLRADARDCRGDAERRSRHTCRRAPMLGFPHDQVATEGQPPPPDGHGAETPYSVVDATYFSTLGIDVLQGRTFDSRDKAGSPEVVVINATMARQHWPGGDPIGQALRSRTATVSSTSSGSSRTARTKRLRSRNSRSCTSRSPSTTCRTSP